MIRDRIELKESLNMVGFEFPEQFGLQNLLQRQLEQLAVRANSKTDLVGAPTVFTQSALAREVLRGLGYPATRKMTSDMAWAKVDDRLAPAGLTHLALDEAQYSFTPSSVGRASYQSERIKIQGALSRLLDHPMWPLPLVLIWLPVLIHEYANNDFTFMRERSDFIEIKSMSVDDLAEHRRLQRGIRALCDVAGINWNLHNTDHLFGRLIHAAGRARGIAIHLAKEAVLEAVQQGAEALQITHFRDVYALNTGAPVAANPFVSPDWSQVVQNEIPLARDEGVMSQIRKLKNAQ